MKKSLSLVIACILAVALFSGCGEKKEKKAGSAVEKIKAAGELVVYTNPEFAPYEYLGKDEQIVGAEIDIVHKIAAKLGVKAKVVSAEFDSIIGTARPSSSQGHTDPLSRVVGSGVISPPGTTAAICGVAVAVAAGTGVLVGSRSGSGVGVR